MNAMFAAINSLPDDDPLRAPANAAAQQQIAANDQAAAEAALHAQQASAKQPGGVARFPEKVMAAFHAAGNTTSVMPDAVVDVRSIASPPAQPVAVQRTNGAVVVDAGRPESLICDGYPGPPLECSHDVERCARRSRASETDGVGG
jgi:cell division protein FtsI (penicillin-binding protein 3)